MTRGLVPEEAVVDAISSDALKAGALLEVWSDQGQRWFGDAFLADLARKVGLSVPEIRGVLAGLCSVGVFERAGDTWRLVVDAQEAKRHAAVLRGVAYAGFRQRDANDVEIALSPPAHPSRLMELLPRQGFAWTRLYHTKDSLIELASQAARRFVIVTPFLDEDGIDWIEQLFEATRGKSIQRTLIMRGTDEKEAGLVQSHAPLFEQWDTKVMCYAIRHDVRDRNPALETFHAKLLLADSDKAYIGSSNMTRWSRDYSMECGVIVRGPAVKPVATLVQAILAVASDWQGWSNGLPNSG